MPSPQRDLLSSLAVLTLAGGLAFPAVGAPPVPEASGSAFGSTVPTFSIWDVKLGHPVSEIPNREVVNVACGTDGGPPSVPLRDFSEFAKCPAEPSGLHEVYFQYDDEQDYVAKALDLEGKYLQPGTTVYAHAVIVSVLIDDQGIARGIRIVTDDRASLRDRRGAASLESNLAGRFADWKLDCRKIPPADGQEGIGTTFVNDICSGADPAGDERLWWQSRYFRLKGQTAIDPFTRKLVRDNFLSDTHFELVQAPYRPEPPSAG